MLNPEERALYANLLSGVADPAGLPPQTLHALLARGALVSLQEDGTPDAITILKETALASPAEETRSLAQSILAALAGRGNPPALEALFDLAIHHQQPIAIDLIRAANLHAPNPEREILFLLLSGQPEAYLAADPGYRLLTPVFLDADQCLQERVIHAAQAAGLQHYATLLALAQGATPGALEAFLGHYPTYLPGERELALRLLTRLASEGHSDAREALGQLFLRYEDAQARVIAVQNQYAPADSIQRALFLFLSEQWKEYDVFDFDHRRLIAAYETADHATRKRLLDLSRHSGQMEWFQALSGANRKRWLGDLSDADWETATRRLAEAGRWPELWRLAQLASPVWSASILEMLVENDWRPASALEQEQLQALSALSQEAAANPLTIRAGRNFQVPGIDDLTALALSPDGKTLTLGSASNAIHLWNLQDIPAPLPTLYVSAPQARALAFSPDGEYLVAGMGDNALHVYRLYDGREIKKLEGHTGLVRGLGFSPDSRTLYSAGFDGTLRAWRFPFGPETKIIHRTSSEIFGLAISPAGDLLADAGADRVLAVFQLPDGQPVHELEGHQATITGLASAPDTRYVASASRDGTIRVWNMVSGRPIQVIPNQQDTITGLCIHTNEEILFSAGYKGKITLFNISTGKPLYELVSHRRAIIGLALSPDGSTLISASADGAVSLWNLEIFVQSRLPVEAVRPDRLAELRQKAGSKALTPAERKWLAFIIELLQWKQRFDVQIDQPQLIALNEFDIQL